jgi:hypothetical protein
VVQLAVVVLVVESSGDYYFELVQVDVEVLAALVELVVLHLGLHVVDAQVEVVVCVHQSVSHGVDYLQVHFDRVVFVHFVHVPLVLVFVRVNVCDLAPHTMDLSHRVYYVVLRIVGLLGEHLKGLVECTKVVVCHRNLTIVVRMHHVFVGLLDTQVHLHNVVVVRRNHLHLDTSVLGRTQSVVLLLPCFFMILALRLFDFGMLQERQVDFVWT